MSADGSTALSAAAIRITRGNPTAEEVAAVAVLLTARLRLAAEAQAAAGQEESAVVFRLPRRRPPVFAPPGAWAS
ncbi:MULTISPECIES: acyl-CoA carboxylase epsilon subunit [Streptomyces]|uniref:acyl-CoA carboxylase epsilon subunit n=1 Tax=Streptomyces TaxID=1883 RepID=UPI000F73E06B|nr:acyl-CoA carboxylase epsilon subunit [Streptomyces sp. WAC05292]RSS81007.1 acyl-CoA carboxylase subunit epsilon [Streptomyces sp. WAC05292]